MVDGYSGEVFIDHIGIACNNLEDSSNFWRLMGLAESEEDEVVESQGVKIRFFSTSASSAHVNPPRFELLESLGVDTPIGKKKKKKGQGVQQVCLRVEDLNLVIGYLKDNGIEMINDEPMQGADNSLIAFVHPRSTGGVLIELTQTL